MRRSRRYLVFVFSGLSAFLALSSNVLAAAGAEFSALNVQILPDKTEMIGKLYVGRGQKRQEMGEDQKQRINILDLERNVAWILNPSRREYIEFKGPAQENIPSRPPLPGEPGSLCGKQKGLTCNEVGAERINGRNTEKWEIVVAEGGREMRSVVWVDRGLGVPVREELEGGYVRELRDIQEGPQDPSLFQVPAEYKRIELPKPPATGTGSPERPAPGAGY
ncbi:MAG: hypothetical protein ACFCVA_05280 [Gammaproteobacteria bacterium]